MDSANALMRVAENPAIDQIAEPLSKAVRAVFDAAGPGGRQAKNALHGVWLGHPLHPVFTDLPIGAWTTALALDMTANGDPERRRAATFAMGVGLGRCCGRRSDGAHGLERNGRPLPARRVGPWTPQPDGDHALRHRVRVTAEGRSRRWRALRLVGLRDRAGGGVPRR